MKSSPGFVTRTAAALVTPSFCGNPPASGVTPQLVQLEQPPPLHDATKRKRTTTSAWRHQVRSISDLDVIGARELPP
jgi:hypothetical protein